MSIVRLVLAMLVTLGTASQQFPANFLSQQVWVGAGLLLSDDLTAIGTGDNRAQPQTTLRRFSVSPDGHLASASKRVKSCAFAFDG